MYRAGHYGAALLVYTPIGFVVYLVGYPALALLGGTAMIALSMLPDYDSRLPLIEHRGPTHSVLFALLVGTAVATVGGMATDATRTSPALVTGFGFLVGTLAVLVHIALDVINPAGVSPFWPISHRRYSLNLVRASNPLVNNLLFLAGLLVAGLAIGILGDVFDV